jgi:hypothetical protein
MITRITTVKRFFDHSIKAISEGFDQEAAISLLAKLAIYKLIR